MWGEVLPRLALVLVSLNLHFPKFSFHGFPLPMKFFQKFTFFFYCLLQTFSFFSHSVNFLAVQTFCPRCVYPLRKNKCHYCIKIYFFESGLLIHISQDKIQGFLKATKTAFQCPKNAKPSLAKSKFIIILHIDKC